MSAPPNTLFLRLEGALQSWGSNEAKFALRRTTDAPTKSGVLGLLCAAMGIGRAEAADSWLPKLANLRMGVRIDRPGIRWWDFHTVGAGQRMRMAELKAPKKPSMAGAALAETLTPSKVKTRAETLLSRREYLADASFLVALQGEPELVAKLSAALAKPVWAIYLGRKSCPPSHPVGEHAPGFYNTLEEALSAVPLQKRWHNEPLPQILPCVMDWIPSQDGEHAPDDAEIHYDLPVSFQPPRHLPRFVIRRELVVGEDVQVSRETGTSVWRPKGTRADYNNSEYKKVRAERLVMDHAACMVCKAPATTVQHVNYRRAGGKEIPEDLRALCRLCHDACTMLEYGSGMTTDRIDPCDPIWRERILAKRKEIVEFRSRGQRFRKMKPEEENG